jgi:hypothetical protein
MLFYLLENMHEKKRPLGFSHFLENKIYFLFVLDFFSFFKFSIKLSIFNMEFVFA